MSDAAKPRLKVSREGVVLIKSFEGFRPYAVHAHPGWKIGYGHTASAREGATVTEAEAELLLQYDLAPVVKILNDEVAAPLNQHQFDALASFGLSIGAERLRASEVMRRLNAGLGDPAEALMDTPAAIAKDAGLHRRAAERALFNADPGQPNRLADLMIAPVAHAPASTSPADARAAAVAALLGETDGLAPFPASAEPDATGEDWTTPLEADPSGPETHAPTTSPAPPAIPATPPPTPETLKPATPSTPVDDATAAAVVQPVTRHEIVDSRSQRFDWSETGMYIIMGVLGLIACAFAAAATRLTLLRPSPGGESGAIAWALAIIGVMCVGVSAWNLYTLWGRRP